MRGSFGYCSMISSIQLYIFYILRKHLKVGHHQPVNKTPLMAFGWRVDSGQPVCAGMFFLLVLDGIFKCTLVFKCLSNVTNMNHSDNIN